MPLMAARTLPLGTGTLVMVAVGLALPRLPATLPSVVVKV
jgi:hypothetical protein